LPLVWITMPRSVRHSAASLSRFRGRRGDQASARAVSARLAASGSHARAPRSIRRSPACRDRIGERLFCACACTDTGRQSRVTVGIQSSAVSDRNRGDARLVRRSAAGSSRPGHRIRRCGQSDLRHAGRPADPTSGARAAGSRCARRARRRALCSIAAAAETWKADAPECRHRARPMV